MGIYRRLFGRGNAAAPRPAHASFRKATVGRRRAVRGRVEQLEPRQMLAGDGLAPEVLLGSVYFEEATGDDSAPDIIEVSFVGGAEGTTLNRLIINGDKDGLGLTTGDIIFDTADGGLGAFKAVGLNIESHDGFEVTGVSVVDGGSQIIFTFSGFDAGEVFRFSLDVDEVQYVAPGAVVDGVVVDPTGIDVNSVVEGAEFQRSIITGEFSAPGYVDLTLQATYWDAFDPHRTSAEANTGLQLGLPDDAYSNTHDYSDRTAGAVAHQAQIPLARLSGWVYHDRSNDGQFDHATEQGIGGVTLELLDAHGNPTGITTVTSSGPGSVGYYEFLNLHEGTYGVREVQPDGWLDGKDTPGSHGGTAADESAGRVDRIVGATLAYGDHATEYNFGELLVGSISGYVFASTGPHCDPNDPEIRLAGVTIDLIDATGTVIATTKTLADGSYLFTGVAPGVYTVRQHQPTDYYDGDEHIGSEGGESSDIGDTYSLFTNIVLGSGVDAVRYDFCEHVGPSLSGWVYHDRSNDGDFDPTTEEGIGGVVIELLDANGVPTGITTVTSTETGKVGYYEFTNLAPGKYGVREVQPVGWLDGKDTAGTHGGAAASEGSGRVDRITGATLQFGDHAQQYNFGELLPGSIAGRVGASTGPDCDFDNPEILLEGVRIDLLDKAGTIIATVYTNAEGRYKFDNLTPDEYWIREHQPDGYLDGGERIGTAGGIRETNDEIKGIVLGSDVHGINYDFCEHTPGSLSGRVIISNGPDCEFDDPDGFIANVRIDLLDAAGNLLATTYTDAEGRYRFDGLGPGEYQIFQHQPDDYYDGGERIGTAAGERLANDRVGKIQLGTSQHGENYDFCEHIGVNLSGWVYHDRSNDGVFDRDSEEGIAQVTLKLLNADGTDTGRRAVTDERGYYQFSNLGPGTYSVMEIHPTEWLDGIDTPGNVGGIAADSPGDMISQITLDFGTDAVEYNFGELLPGSIRGTVYVSTTPDCGCDSEKPGLAGVKIELLNDQGQIVATTTTDADGNYAFDNLLPGTYSVRQIQPIEYFDGGYKIGSGGGDEAGPNRITSIFVGSGSDLVKYDFCEVPPADLSGYVFIDGAPILVGGTIPSDLSVFRDGQRTPDDTPLAGVVLELRDGITGQPIYADATLPGYYGPGPIRVVTDARGFYEFKGLAAGSYAVVQIQPEGLLDGIDTPGSLGGLAVNPVGWANDPTLSQPGGITPEQSQAIDAMRGQFGNNVIFQIVLTPGSSSVENNFSEVRTTPFWIPPSDDPPGERPFFPAPQHPLPPLYFPLYHVEAPAPIIYGGSGGVVGYTWHLSLINAGSPRSMQVDTEVAFQFVSAQEQHDWEPGDLEQGRWTLGDVDEDEEGRMVVMFGIEGGIPVVGDWDGDGKDEIAIFHNGRWYFDLNGNGQWDAGDMVAKLGQEGDFPTTGDWDGDGKTDIAIYGPIWHGDLWAIQYEPGLPDADNHPGPMMDKEKNVPPTLEDATQGVRELKMAAERKIRKDLIDHVFHYGIPGDHPVTGDWNGDGIATIGIYRDGVWILDTDGDGRLTDTDERVVFGSGIPVVGDWNGDGIDDLGTFDAGRWTIDSNGNRELDARDKVFELGEAGDLPVAGDWNGDGIDQPGVYTPPGNSASPMMRQAG